MDDCIHCIPANQHLDFGDTQYVRFALDCCRIRIWRAESASSTPALSGYLVLNFADGSKSAPINLISLDWYVLSHPPIAGHFRSPDWGNHYTTNSGTSFIEGYNGVALHQTDINLLGLGCAGKSLVSITFVGVNPASTSNRTTTGIFAVSGVATDLGINPPASSNPMSLIRIFQSDGPGSSVGCRWRNPADCLPVVTTAIQFVAAQNHNCRRNQCRPHQNQLGKSDGVST